MCSCHIFKDYLKRLETNLQKELVDQQEAKDLLIDKMRMHNFGKDATKPTTIHLAGDNGVGKTLTTRILATSLYPLDRHGVPNGLLFLRANSYRATDVEALRDKIASHLYSCPRGLIVIDEAEAMVPNIVNVFQQFLDSTVPWFQHNGKVIFLASAIFVFASDFGVEGRTAGMSLEKIRNLVYRESVVNWKDPKHPGLIPFVIPYAPLSADGLNKMVKHMLLSLTNEIKLKKEIVITPISLQRLVTTVTRLASQPRFKFANYRGVSNAFEELVKAPVFKAIAGEQNQYLEIQLIVDDASSDTIPPVKVVITKQKSDL